MVRYGPRPAHRKGTTGQAYRRFRASVVDGATHCPNCGKAYIRNAACDHPRHQGMPGCPTHPGYPTLQHHVPLVAGGQVRDRATATHWCYSCNAKDGARVARARQNPGRSQADTSRTW